MHPKTLEMRMRRTLDRRGYALHKIRRQDPLALGYGTYYIVDHKYGGCVFPDTYGETRVGASLDEIVEWVDGMEDK